MALDLEAELHIAALAAETDERGHRLVIRNGHVGPGAVEIKTPRIRNRREA